MPIRGTRCCVERRVKYFFIAVIMLVSSSCGTYQFFNTSDFGKIKDLSELNGTYRNEDTPQTKLQSILRFLWGTSEDRRQMMDFFHHSKFIDDIVLSDSVIREAKQEWENRYMPLNFSSSVIDDIILSESIKEEYKPYAIHRILSKLDSVMIQFPNNHTLVVSFLVNDTVYSAEFKGKKKRNYFEIYKRKKQLIIPFIYINVDVDRLRIGRYKKKNDLLIRHLDEETVFFLFIGTGHGGERPYVYKRIE